MPAPWKSCAVCRSPTSLDRQGRAGSSRWNTVSCTCRAHRSRQHPRARAKRMKAKQDNGKPVAMMQMGLFSRPSRPAPARRHRLLQARQGLVEPPDRWRFAAGHEFAPTKGRACREVPDDLHRPAVWIRYGSNSSRSRTSGMSRSEEMTYARSPRRKAFGTMGLGSLLSHYLRDRLLLAKIC